jgi:uncharacterized membrane protein YeaQ/YmgE (transglycosylase-associated protein family)
MVQIALNRCIDKELRYYGFTVLGLLVGVSFLIIIWAQYGMIVGIVAGVIGVIIGDNISKYWHIGFIQRWCYWNFPTLKIIRSNYFPKSCERKFL